MKTYQLKTTPDDLLQRFPALLKRLAAAPAGTTVCLGADLEKAGACLSAQIGLGAPLALGTLTRAQGTALAGALGARGCAVAVAVANKVPVPLCTPKSTTRSNAVQSYYRTSQERTHDTRHARLNTQRKILEALWLMWRRHESFKPELFFPATGQPAKAELPSVPALASG